ncbi:TVP38/TMEM64 family protein [Acidaminobacter sp. JC074]|uniref:TVP38/TMEM64 family protein n=1 Tax=Acidaminobacter sp. JC074 TaxID=2530199 RepID=UPI001F0DF776|nr:TVP38/TMEM64 family protein [Acidaminobacter sp. JC074]MCH4890299.1 TVP38/TMEM64 family protein [Acidaminobacter sp. JC074]
MKSKKDIIKYGLIMFALIAIIIMTNKYVDLSQYTPEDIRDYVNSYGMLAPLVYIIIFTLVPLTLFPDSIIAVSGGMCFGLFWGSIYTMIGAFCGGTLSFYLSRLVGKNFITSVLKKDLPNIGEDIDNRGFMAVLILRLIPLFPYDIISYGAGLSKIKYKDFILATLIGIIPGVIVFVNLGSQFTQIGSRGFYMAISLLVMLFISSGFLKKRLALKR